jgi:hypothetical protein
MTCPIAAEPIILSAKTAKNSKVPRVIPFSSSEATSEEASATPIKIREK